MAIILYYPRHGWRGFLYISGSLARSMRLIAGAVWGIQISHDIVVAFKIRVEKAPVEIHLSSSSRMRFLEFAEMTI
jgi:hypothetical protein